MNDKELRELDAWIAEHVMGWQERQAYRGSEPLKDQTFWVDDKCRPATRQAFRGHHSIPNYTTNPADAFKVLEKCAEKCWPDTVEISVTDGYWRVIRGDMDRTAPTLPLAIALFAKQLFT